MENICQKCKKKYDKNEYFMCSDNHIFCETCISDYLISPEILNNNLIEYYETNEYIKCPLCDCEGELNEDLLLKSSINTDYLKIILKLSNIITTRENESIMIKTKYTSNTASDVIISNINKILKNCILCPSCGQEFNDFVGCLALMCCNCKTYFCGVCLKNDNICDAFTCHKHVKQCIKTKENKGIMFHGNYFISDNDWPKLHEDHKITAVLNYLSQIKFNVLWSSIDDITSYLKKNNLLSESNIKEIENVVFSQNTNGVNLIRIQYIFWMIYSSKKI